MTVEGLIFDLSVIIVFIVNQSDELISGPNHLQQHSSLLIGKILIIFQLMLSVKKSDNFTRK